MDNELIEAPLRIARLEEALALLGDATREPQASGDDAPVFVASVGWRSGSTLMQRLLMTDPSILIWGEPMSQAGFVEASGRALFGIDKTWPDANHWITHRPDLDRTRDWVATLSPDAGHLRAAYQRDSSTLGSAQPQRTSAASPAGV